MAGLRERKKRQTRQHISDVATGLFLERGFDAVTVAEVAEAADVSVNTVYNYFPAKEDLFFDREDDVVACFARCIRERAPGESAAEALLGKLRRDIKERRPQVGLSEGHARFLRTMHCSPALMTRLMRMRLRIVETVAQTLREEAGAPLGDHVPELVATQLVGLQAVIQRTAGEGAQDGVPVDEIAQLMLEKLEVAESLLSDRVLGYARRPAG